MALDQAAAGVTPRLFRYNDGGNITMKRMGMMMMTMTMMMMAMR